MNIKEFSFVFDPRIKEILERDYQELRGLNSQTATKSTIVLAGGVIEGLLIDALTTNGPWTFEQCCKKGLKDLIDEAIKEKILKEDRLSNATREYRNIIHPGREIREQMIFELADADMAKASAKIIIREIRAWSLTEKKRRDLRNAINKLTQSEKDFLQLFGQQKPSSSQYDHPWLQYEVYASRISLIQKEIIEIVQDDQLSEHQEKVQLLPVAAGLVEQLLLQTKLQRNDFILSHKNIAASNIGGSGAPLGGGRRA